MTPEIWTDVQDDLRTALQAAERAVAKGEALDEVPEAFRLDREIAIGKHLHDAYSAAEKEWQRMVAAVDGDVPAGRDFHQALIDRALRDDPETRPALVTAETAAGMRVLVRFRHAFRHSYEAFDFGPARDNLQVAAATIPRLRDELTAFAAAMGLAPRA